ncbi:S1 family peptidase [Niveibacterium terrae]|uniref:S1 family peptidase n=1 Tax=Niveibacterium terrae TaxID=3373598 RepID=UPI003A92B0EF
MSIWSRLLRRSLSAEALLILAWLWPGAAHADLTETIRQVKPSIVAVGTFQRARSPQFHLLGTGFVVGDGSLIATNSHVVPTTLDEEHFEELIVISMPSPGTQQAFKVAKVGSDPTHDLALLKLTGARLAPLTLGDGGQGREGQSIAFTGYPIIGILGPNPATHRGIVAAITPIVLPQQGSAQLNAQAVRRAREGAFNVLQLDATAYPGNSGSPVFDPDSGVVLAIVNMVFVKGSRESALSQPSGITYAIPIQYLKSLLATVGR